MLKQVSVFLENKPGRLAELMQVLEEAGVRVKALSIAEAGGYGVVRAVVDDHAKALRVLQEANMAANEVNVIAISLRDGLYRASKALGEAEVNIEYAYTAQDAVILKVDDEARAVKALRANGVATLSNF